MPNKPTPKTIAATKQEPAAAPVLEKAILAPYPPTIHLALAAITRDMDAIQKLRKNEQQGFKFRGIDDVYNALHPIFAAHGVVCIPLVEKLETSIPGQNAKGNNIYRSIVTMGYKLMASDGSFIEAKTVGEGFDFADKATAKSLAVAHKYLLLQMFLIPTEDLVDGDYYDPTVMPREKLKEIEEARAKEAVLAGGDMDLPDSQAAALEEKRKSLTGQPPEGATLVEGKALPPVENPDEPAFPAAPAEPAEKRTRAPRKVAVEPEAEPAPKATKQAAGDLWEYVITQVTMAEYHNKKLGDFTPEQVEFLFKNWVEKYQHKFATNPAKQADAEKIKLAYAYHFQK